jgi:hypothetical protein
MNPNRNINEAQDFALTLARTFASMAEAAPVGGIKGDDVQSDSRGILDAKPNLVKLVNGWGEKYVKPIELTGDRWLEVFAEAKALVSKSALVAFIGGRGPGKTQMAAEIARGGDWPLDEGEWIGGAGGRMQRNQTAIYRRAMDVFLDLRDCNKSGSKVSEKDVLGKLSSPGFLVIDEFQERGGSEWENRIIANLIDKRYAAKRPTVIIGNYNREQMRDALGDSIKSRMRENGKAFVFDWESFRRASAA